MEDHKHQWKNGKDMKGPQKMRDDMISLYGKLGKRSGKNVGGEDELQKGEGNEETDV
jgi:hypothetical protein